MPVIACPGCGKQYKITATAAGQVAKCACGKRFRLGGTAPSAASSAPEAATAKTAGASAAVAAPTPKRATVAASAAVSPVAKIPPAKSTPAKDDFWDDVLPATYKPSPPAESSSSGATAQSAMIKSGGPAAKKLTGDKADPKPKKRKKKSGGVKWGFDWGKVVGGLITFLIFGGITAAMVMTTGRISIYLAIIAAGGLFTMLNGLMGEEGIW